MKSPGLVLEKSWTFVLPFPYEPCFNLLSVSCLVVALYCSINTTVMLTVFFIIDKPGRGYHYSDRNACGESAASKKYFTLAILSKKVREYDQEMPRSHTTDKTMAS